jgi:hypothetical protein
MLCEKFDTRLHEVLDQRERAELDTQLREHALTCDDCAERLAAQASLFEGLRAAAPPALGPDFTNRVLTTVKTRQITVAWRKVVWSLLAVAAVLLVAALPAWWWLAAGQSGGSGPIRAGHDGPSLAQDGPAPANERGSAATPNNPIETRDQDTSPQQLLDTAPAPDAPNESAVAIDSSPSADDIAPEGLFREGILPWEIAANFPGVDKQRAEMLQSVWTERVATPLKPVTSSVTGAVNVLRRTLAVDPAIQSDADEQEPQAGIANGVRIKDLA